MNELIQSKFAMVRENLQYVLDHPSDSLSVSRIRVALAQVEFVLALLDDETAYPGRRVQKA